MMGVIANPRERMIRSAAALFRERGVEATSLSDVIELSGAPRGSIYHHFPGGKAELAEAATVYSGDFIAAALEEADPAAAIRAFADALRNGLEATGFGAGCPVAAAAVAGERAPGARAAAGAAFERWTELVADALELGGVEPERARSLATVAIAAVEGAIVLARSQRSSEPLERVADELELLLAAALRS